MRKQITLAIVTALFGLAITFAAIAGLAITFREVVVTTSADVIHPAKKLLSAFDARLPLQESIPSRTAATTDIDVEPMEELLPMANPYLRLRELDPVY
jgi:hypothetical protein